MSLEPDTSDIASADYGAPVTSASAEEQARLWMAQTLRDPDSARYRFARPARAWWILDTDEAPVYGWGVAFMLNAKNGYGGYTGEVAHVAVFCDGKLWSVLPSDAYPRLRFGFVND